jgi:hypothetical protein
MGQQSSSGFFIEGVFWVVEATPVKVFGEEGTT